MSDDEDDLDSSFGLNDDEYETNHIPPPEATDSEGSEDSEDDIDLGPDPLQRQLDGLARSNRAAAAAYARVMDLTRSPFPPRHTNPQRSRGLIPSYISPMDPLFQPLAANEADDPNSDMMKPHARFFIERNKSMVSIKFDPPAYVPSRPLYS
jgi:hypothetical protein